MPYRHRWIALAAILRAEVMNLLDGTIMNVAASTIRNDLGGSYTGIQSRLPLAAAGSG